MNSLRSLLLAPLRAFSEVGLLLTLLAANLGVALVQSVPLIIPALGVFGHALSGRGKPFPSSEAVLDLGKALAQGGGSFLAGSVLLGFLLSSGQQLLFAGGIASRVCSAERFSLSEFSRQSARLLGRNLRLFLWSRLGLIPVAAVAVGAGFASTAAGKPTLFNLESGQWSDNPFTGWNVAHLGLALLLFALWRASVDLARIQLFADDQRKTRIAYWRACKELVRSPGAVVGYAVLGLVGLLVVIALMRMHASMRITSATRAGLALLAAQVVVLARLGFSVATSAFTVDMYRVMVARVAATPAAGPEPAVATEPPATSEPPPAAEPVAAAEPIAVPEEDARSSGSEN